MPAPALPGPAAVPGHREHSRGLRRPRDGGPVRAEPRHEGRGLRHQAGEVARRLAAGEAESPLMPLDETISIMETMDTVLAQARRHP